MSIRFHPRCIRIGMIIGLLMASVAGSGYGFYIHNGAETGNVVRSDIKVTGAAESVSSVPCS